MTSKLKTIKLFLEVLESHKLINTIHRVGFFHDEPKINRFVIGLNYPKDLSDGIKPDEGITSTGSSFDSPYDALLLSLYEAVERLSVYCFRKKSIIFSTRHNLKEKSIDLSSYNDDVTIDYFKLGWIKAKNVINNSNYLVPAHFVYLNFSNTYKESPITTLITTGAAGGFTHEETLLRGIYEIVERDAFMTIYLNKISVPRISIKNIPNQKLQSIIRYLKRYNLELYVLDITNDLQIPSFASVIIDRTGLGPAVTIGLKSGFHIVDAIIGCIKEALSTRTWIRYRIYQDKKHNLTIDPKQIRSLDQRGVYWFPKSMLPKIEFMIKSSPQPLRWPLSHTYNKGELDHVVNMLNHKKFDIYFVDITPKIFAHLNYKIYKVIIPKMQPVYLNEKRKEFRIDRLRKVAKYFGKNKYYLNLVPHPFL